MSLSATVSGQRADGLNDETVAAKPRDQQHQQAKETELQIGEQDLAIGALKDLGLVEPHHKARITRWHAHVAENATDPVKALTAERPLIAFAELLKESSVVDSPSEPR
jgi:hypothetical protein